MKGAIYHGIENVTVEDLTMPECGEYDLSSRKQGRSVIKSRHACVLESVFIKRS